MTKIVLSGVIMDKESLHPISTKCVYCGNNSINVLSEGDDKYIAVCLNCGFIMLLDGKIKEVVKNYIPYGVVTLYLADNKIFYQFLKNESEYSTLLDTLIKISETQFDHITKVSMNRMIDNVVKTQILYENK